MEIRYERDLINAYMVMPAEKEEAGYEERMVLENRIRGFLPIQKRCCNGKEEYYYCISSLVSLEEYLEHTPLGEVFLKQLIFTVCRGMEELKGYLLTEEQILLRPDTVFVEEIEKEPFAGRFTLCLYPGEKQNMREGLRELIKYMMGKTDRSDERGMALCYELYGLLQKDNFCMREFMEVLERSAVPEPAQEPEKKKWKKQLFASRRNSGILSA